MANFRRKLSAILQFLKRKFRRKKQVRRSELLRVVRGGMFRRLEPRRVLSVNATLNAGVLDISILSNDADTTAVLKSASDTEFFVDGNSNDMHDGSELRALFAELNQINVSGDGNSTAFFWRDNFATASLNLPGASGSVVNVSNVNSFESSATATIDGNASIAANESVKFGGDLNIAGDLTANASNATSTLSTLGNAKLEVSGTTQFSANEIELAGATGNINFADLTIKSTAGTTISGAITGENVDINCNGFVDVKVSGSIDATTLIIDSTGSNSDIRIDGRLTSTGNMELHVDDSMLLGATSSLSVAGTGNLTLVANSDNSNGDGNDTIEMLDGASLSTDTGSILLSALGTDSGDLILSNVASNSSSTAAVEIRSGANIVDGTAAETANILASNGTVELSALQGAIGDSDDIDIDAINLIFNAANTSAGVVNITDLTGGVRISGVSQAGGGGAITANSPLTISADVNVGASMTFTAGNSAAAGDTLSIDNNAIVTLSSSSAATLIFNAGDDFIFNSGRIVTSGALHNVILAADLDHAGVGSADGDRGTITQDGLPGIEVSTSYLTATAATGIDFDTAIDTLIANTSSTGNIRIREQDAITLTNVTTNDGSIEITARGTIIAVTVTAALTDSDANDVQLTTTGAGDIVVHGVLAGPLFGDVILNAQGNIIDGDAADDLDISGNDVTLTAGGNIGGLSGDVFKGVFNSIEVNVTGNLVASATAGTIALNATMGGSVSLSAITAYVASDGDLIAAPVFSVTNAALIADANHDGLGTLFLGPMLSVLGDLRIEGADIVASDGSIDLTANRLLAKSQQSETLNVSTSILDATTFGNLIVHSSAHVELLDLDCDNVALQTLDAAGFIQLTAIGSILISDDVIAGNDAITSSIGSVTLRATGATSDLTVNDLVLADDGDLIVQADNNIFIGTAISPSEVTDTDNLLVITTINGNIRIQADTDSDLNGNGGAIIMLDGAHIITGRDSALTYSPGVNGLPSSSIISLGIVAKTLGQAEVILEADETITLASVQTANNSANAIRITSFSGAIADAGDQDVDLVANQAGALATLTALTGIGNTNAIETDLHAIDVNNLNNGLQLATGDVAIDEVIAGGDLILVHATTQASTGNLFVRVQSGSLIVPATGNLPSNGLCGVATEQGSLLLQSLTSDVNVAAQIQSQGGHLTLDAADDIRLDAVMSTTATGTVLLIAKNASDDAVGPQIDGMNINANISTVAGDLLIRSNHDVRVNATVSSVDGDIGLVAVQDVLIENSVTTSGNAMSVAGRDFSMSATSSISAGNSLLVNSGRDQTITGLHAANVSLNSGASILDANGAAVNIAASNLNIQAADSIGAADLTNFQTSNGNAIDIRVANVAAQSANGMYLRQVAAGGALTIGHVAAVNVSVDVKQIYFAASSTDVSEARGLSGRDDLRATSGGPIKVVVENGSLFVNEGNDNDNVGVQVIGSGAVLLEARGLAADIVVNARANISSGTGHITLRASDDVYLNADMATAGDGTLFISAANNSLDALVPDVDGINLNGKLNSVNGDILFSSTLDIKTTASITSTTGDIGFNAARDVKLNSTMATAGDVLLDIDNAIEMAPLASIVGGTNAILHAAGDIRLGLVSATNVGLNSGADILDNNGSTTNVRSSNLQITATGSIGQADLPNTLGVNANAIDLEGDTVGALAASGIYLQEVTAGGALTIGHIDAVTVSVSVEQVHFNSTTDIVNDSVTLSLLDDLTTASDGSIKVVVSDGTLTITEGSDGNGVGVSADGSGDVLLEARGASSDVNVNTNASVRSGTGHVTVVAADDVHINASVSTAGNGTLFVQASNADNGDAIGPAVDGINLNATLSTVAGDIFIHSLNDIRATANSQSLTGDIALNADRDLALETNVTTAGNVFVDVDRDFDMAPASVLSASNVIARSLGNQILGLIDATRVAVQANGNIVDGNGAAVNVRANSASLVAGGSIGAPDLGSVPSTNDNAIDLNIKSLAAQSSDGLYLREVAAGGALTIGRVDAINFAIEVGQANFNSTLSRILTVAGATALDDLTSTGSGAIKVVVANGPLTITEGDDNDGFGVESRGTGDILLEARGTNGNIVVGVDAGISTQGGNIVLVAGDDIHIGSEVTTVSTGVIYFKAANGSNDAALPNVDGININRSVTTDVGNILLDSSRDIRLAASLVTNSGSLGLIASRDIIQLANLTTTGDVLLDAGGDIIATGSSIQAGANLVAKSGAAIQLGFVGATNVALDAGTNIDDLNVGIGTRIRASQLSMRAGSMIGNADLLNASSDNARAIDTEVTTLAAISANGIYLFEMIAGGNLTIGHVDAIGVTVAVNQVNFNSSTDLLSHSRSLAELNDLTSEADGPIKVVVANGTLLIESGDGDGLGIQVVGSGDVLLEARGVGDSDVVIAANAAIQLGTGNLTILARDDITISAALSTSGAGTLYAVANNNTVDGVSGLSMTQGTSITTVDGDILLRANSEGNISLALIESRTGTVSIAAEGSIVDANFSRNVRALELRMVADSNNNGSGLIGGPDALNGNPNSNANAIDTQVTVLSARSAEGIYIRELDGLTVGQTSRVTVQQSNFNSSTTLIHDTDNADLVTTNRGSIKLQSVAGDLTLEDGDSNGIAVQANGLGDVLVQTLAADGDIVIDADVVSAIGHISLLAGDDLRLNGDRDLLTGGDGTIYLLAANRTNDAVLGTVDGIQANATVTTTSGDILFSSQQDLLLNGNLASTLGDIGLVTRGNLVQSSSVVTGSSCFVETGGSWTMQPGASVTASSNLLGLVGVDIDLHLLSARTVSLQAGGNISDTNGSDVVNVVADQLILRAGGAIGASNLSAAAAVNANAIDVNVNDLAATALAGIYIQQVQGAGTLTITNIADASAVVSVGQVNFNSTRDIVDVAQTRGALADIESTQGPIKIAVRDGSVIVNEGGDGDGWGVHIAGTGHILLEAHGANGDVITRADVISGGGNITLSATDDIQLNAAVGSQSLLAIGAGTIYLSAANETQDTLPGFVDGIDIAGSIRSQQGDILVRSEFDIRQTQSIVSSVGNVGLVAGNDYLQTANVATAGSVLVDARRQWTMSAPTSISAGASIVASAGQDIQLSLVSADRVALRAGQDMLDSNGGNATNIIAQQTSLRAGRAIGQADPTALPLVNRNTIELRVDTVAADAAAGIYLLQTGGVGNLTVDRVDEATVTVSVSQVNFNSSTTPTSVNRSLDTLSDLESERGPIKVFVTSDSLIINEGGDGDGWGVRVNGGGDILLQTRDQGLGTNSSDVTINADVLSGSGNVTISAGDDVYQRANVMTSRSKAAASGGTIFVRAANGTVDGVGIDGVVMSNGTITRSHDGVIRLLAENESDIILAFLDTVDLDFSAGSVSLIAERSILDGAASSALLNVQSGKLRMVADSNNNGTGAIGTSDVLDGQADANANAITTQVELLSALASAGIYVHELDTVTITSTGIVSIEQVNFNSTNTSVSDLAQSDLSSTAGAVKLLSTNGWIVVDDGDPNGVGISASADVLVWARQDVVINADVATGAGHVTLRAADDIDLNADVFTIGGSIYLMATNDTADATSGVDMQQGTLIGTSGGNVRILADNEGDILLSQINAGVGSVSLLAEGSILDNEFGMNVRASALRLVADAALSNSSNQLGSIGLADVLNGSPDVNSHAIDSRVDMLAAQSADGIYIAEFDAVRVDSTGDISVQEVRFNSTRTVRTDAGLADLVTTDAGSIKLESLNGGITVNDGDDDDDGVGISAATTGDVLLWARQDVVINADVATGAGHVTLRAADDIDLNADVFTIGGSIYLMATNDTADATSGVDMQQGTLIGTSGGNVRILADNEGDILLSQINAGVGSVSLLAEGSILDNEFGMNVRASVLRMVADAALSNSSNQLGSIGLADVLNSSPDVNSHAIDSRVDVLAAQSADGIYIAETDAVRVDSTGDISVQEVRFSSTRAVRTDAGLADLVTTDAGSIKLVSLNGAITVNDGDDDGVGNSAATTGDVLLEAFGDVRIHADISSESGQVQLRAGDDVNLNANISTGLAGSIFISAGNRMNDASGLEVDGINIDGTLLTATGDILLVSSLDIAIRADILSTSGDIGFVAGRDSALSANVLTAGDMLVETGRNFTFSAVNSIEAGANIVSRSVGSQTLGLMAAVNVSLDAGGNIVDGNGGGIINVRSTNLSVRATGSIGDSDLSNIHSDANRNAIDLEVSTLAAQAGTGIYIQEVASGGDITIGHVNGVSVGIDVGQVNFNSTTTPVQRTMTLSALDDLTSGGPIKVVVSKGSLNVTDGPDHDGLGVQSTGNGDILLEARGVASDLSIGLNADVRSNGGNIALLADDDVHLIGDVETVAAFVYVSADNQTNDPNSGVTMSDNAFIRNNDGSMLIEANNESDIVLGLLDTVEVNFSAGSVSLRATGSILDGASDLMELNVQTGVLRMVADSNGDGAGTIGLSSPADGGYRNAVDTQVQVLAAVSAKGIYIREVDGVTVAATGAIYAEQVRFNSSSTTVTHETLSDLENRVDGNIILVSEGGNIVITDGDGDNNGVVANGMGNILLMTSDAGDDIFLDANVLSGTGQVTVSAGRNIGVSATINTDRRGSAPDIYLRAFSGFIDEGPTADTMAKVIGGSLELWARTYAHLHDTTVESLTATVGANGLLQSWQLVNSRVSQRGDDFLLDALGSDRINYVTRNGVLTQIDATQSENPPNAADPRGNFSVDATGNNPLRTRYDDVAKLHRFEDTYAGQYALFIKNSQSLVVKSVAAGSSANPNVYIETVGTTSDLKVTGEVLTASTNDREGGIVLIAGRTLDLVGDLKTSNTLRTQFIDEIGDATADNFDEFGPRRSVLNATIYNGGQGIQPQGDFTSTQFVIRFNTQSLLYEDYRTHIYQRVVAHGGFAGESGFMSYIGYADGNVQQFDVSGEIGIRDGNRSQLNLGDQNSIQAALGPKDAMVFSRSIAFTNAFLDSNQKLPTIAIIRRADDFFLFENASAFNAEDIVDLTVEYQAVNEARSLGGRGATELPVDPLAPAIPEPVKMFGANIISRPTDLLTEEIEFAAPSTGEVEVAIYRVFYEDKNSNGQPEQGELPSPDEVKRASIADEEEVAKLKDDGADELTKKRYKLDKFQTRTDGSPTAGEIDQLKQRLLDDPEQKTGAYSIIQKEVDGKEVVLDVFSIRDWEEVPLQDQPLIQLPTENSKAEEIESLPNEKFKEVPAVSDSSRSEAVHTNGDERIAETRSQSRFASAGLIASSLWMIRQSKDRSNGNDAIIPDDLQSQDAETTSSFNRQARRARKLRRSK